MKSIKLGTRKSPLAIWQATNVQTKLESQGFLVEIVPIITKGDKILDVSLSKIGTKGIFTEEIEEQLVQGKIDIAVHSAKDLPSQLPNGFELIAFGKREQPGDVIVGKKDINIDELMEKNQNLSHFQENPNNHKIFQISPIKIGTSSTRRIALIKKYFPTIEIVPMRGNLQTRIDKLESGVCDYLILANAGVIRQNLQHLIKAKLSLDMFIPPAGQGSVAIEVHDSLDTLLKKKISDAFNDWNTSVCIQAERVFLNHFQGGCSIPIFVYAYQKDNFDVHITGGIISLNGDNMVKKSITITDKQCITDETKKLAIDVANSGGKEILKKIKEIL